MLDAYPMMAVPVEHGVEVMATPLLLEERVTRGLASTVIMHKKTPLGRSNTPRLLI